MPSDPPQGRRPKPIRDAAEEIKDMVEDVHRDYDKAKRRGYIRFRTSGLFSKICPHIDFELEED